MLYVNVSFHSSFMETLARCTFTKAKPLHLVAVNFYSYCIITTSYNCLIYVLQEMSL